MAMTDSMIKAVQYSVVFRLLKVRRTRWLTPHMLRTTLGGDALEGFRSEGADDGARLHFPSDPTDTTWVPTVKEGKLVFPEGRPVPPGREYTPRRFDPVAGELDFDFVVHGEGPASAWAAHAVPGHYLGSSGPRRSRVISGEVDWYLLAGDETALPSIGRRLEELPAGLPVVAIIEVANAEEEQPIATAAELELIWLHRDAAGADTTNLLADAIRHIEIPGGNIFAWAAGEASSLRAVRRHLVQERGLATERMRLTGYWKRSIPNWDHHTLLDE